MAAARLLVVLCALAPLACAGRDLPAQRGIEPAAPGRLRPPAGLACPRDRLTSYTGRVLAYDRRPGSLSLRIRTDWDTTEKLTITFPEDAGPARYFLLDGAPFRPADWPAIEAPPGRLRPGMRATAWVCDDGSAVIDWQPSRGGGPQKPE